MASLHSHHTTVNDNFNVHYLEAGARHLPTILLLHGFPASSGQFRTLAPLLAKHYHVIAPDLPGFGLTTFPADFVFTFDKLAEVIQAFLAAIKLTSFALYIFDYGAPVGLRIALKQPESVKAIITQNGNAYNEGFGADFWRPVFDLWNSENSQAARDNIRDKVLTLEATKYQYYEGVPADDQPLIDPLAPQLDYLLSLKDSANQERQIDLFYDYRTNPEKYYPMFHEYFRQSQVPLLAVWGEGDPAFIPPGAEAFRQDLPDAVIKFVDSGHFALTTKVDEIASAILEFLASIKYVQ